MGEPYTADLVGAIAAQLLTEARPLIFHWDGRGANGNSVSCNGKNAIVSVQLWQLSIPEVKIDVTPQAHIGKREAVAARS